MVNDVDYIGLVLFIPLAQCSMYNVHTELRAPNLNIHTHTHMWIVDTYREQSTEYRVQNTEYRQPACQMSLTYLTIDLNLHED